jgi:hypothetical protein
MTQRKRLTMSDASTNARNAWEAGLRVFPLYGFGEACDCGNPHCKAIGKHPRASNWQHTPRWGDEQIDAMEEAGHFVSGFGVLCAGLIVIDIDARNGGLTSFAKLAEAVPEITGAGYIVNTGSGGGSRHLYFSAPDGLALVSHLPNYPGIDFKSSGFVVGEGSRHVSGGVYSAGIGSPHDIEPAPQGLLALLARPDRHRAEYDGRSIDVSHTDIEGMLAHVSPDCDYDTWIRIGMAIHHATGGSGFDLWDTWSATSDKYDPKPMETKWHSFGRSANVVTLGTLIHHAEAGGWSMPVTFGPDPVLQFETPSNGLPFDVSGVDITCPPGFVGQVAEWIESQSRRPRRLLASAAALVAAGNLAGLRYTDDLDGVTTNLFAFCVAGSRTGKEAIQQAVATIHRAAGCGRATHGLIKSEQEIIRNLVRHQPSFYVIDEIGIFLAKVANAQKKGGASYLEGVIGALMAAYSKAAGFMLLGADVREQIRADMLKEMAALKRREDDGEQIGDRLSQLQTAFRSLDNGLEKPFLSLIGFTTPVTFDDLVDFQSATNGFIGRALLFNERDTAPRSKPGFAPLPLPMGVETMAMQIFAGGNYDPDETRIQYRGDRVKVPTDALARDMLAKALDWFEDQAISHKSKSGLEALYLGAYELVSKVSLILAVAEGRRTTEHVRWAFELVRRDVDAKSLLVTANMRAKDAPGEALIAKLAAMIDGDGETIGVLRNRLRPRTREEIDNALSMLVDSGVAEVVEIKPDHGGRVSTVYRAIR